MTLGEAPGQSIELREVDLDQLPVTPDAVRVRSVRLVGLGLRPFLMRAQASAHHGGELAFIYDAEGSFRFATRLVLRSPRGAALTSCVRRGGRARKRPGARESLVFPAG
jgi:hypothetical protein